MLSQAEENYLKCIFTLSEKTEKLVNTNSIARALDTSAASVTDMLKRLSKREYIEYRPYKGVKLSEQGDVIARKLIRKHRLWEFFLCEKLGFSWDEVHDIAEQLEHIQSDDLVERLADFLDHPKFDPHGDPIPDKEGRFSVRKQIALVDLPVGKKGIIIGVREHSNDFLKYLNQHRLTIGVTIKVLEYFEYDQSLKIRLGSGTETVISQKVANNIFVKN